MRIRKICLCLLLSIVLLSGCSSTAQDSTAQTPATENTVSESNVEETPASQRSVSEIYKEISNNVKLVSPVEMSDEFISNYYNIDPNKLEEYVFVMSEEATSAETVVIMKVKDAGDVESIESALGVVVDEKRAEMENYLPEQFAIVDKSSVETKDSYVWLVISENQADITALIKENI